MSLRPLYGNFLVYFEYWIFYITIVEVPWNSIWNHFFTMFTSFPPFSVKTMNHVTSVSFRRHSFEHKAGCCVSISWLLLYENNLTGTKPVMKPLLLLYILYVYIQYIRFRRNRILYLILCYLVTSICLPVPWFVHRHSYYIPKWNGCYETVNDYDDFEAFTPE
jgi:hypothetical protein